jgi:cytochrome c2
MRILMRKLFLLLPLALVLTGCVGPFLNALIPTPAAGDPARGQIIFTQGTNGSPPCSTCHHVASGQTGFSLGPNLAGVAERAASRIEGLSAEEYLRQSIRDPHSYVVSGYRDIMYPNFAQHFNEQDIADLLAYLRTLRAP